MRIAVLKNFKTLGLAGLLTLVGIGLLNVLKVSSQGFDVNKLGFAGNALNNYYPAKGMTIDDFLNLLIGVRNFILFLGILLGIIFLVLGGINYMRAGGDEAKMATARAQIIGGIIGIAVAVAAFVLLYSVIKFVQDAGQGFPSLNP